MAIINSSKDSPEVVLYNGDRMGLAELALEIQKVLGGDDWFITKGDLAVATGILAGQASRLPAGANGLFLRADSSEALGLIWSSESGLGDVVGPSSAVDANIVLFDGTSGKAIKTSLKTIAQIFADHVALSDPHAQYVLDSAVGTMAAQNSNAVSITGGSITTTVVDNLSGTNTGDQTNISGNAATVTTNANLTGHITSTGNATILGSFSSAQLKAALTDETGSGIAVFATSPTLVTPVLGVAAATSIASSGFVGTAVTGAIKLPVGTTAQQPTPATGMLRYNTTDTSFEGYDGSAWGAIGGSAADEGFTTNINAVAANYTLATNSNASSVGPMTVNTGVTVTIPTGSRWVIL